MSHVHESPWVMVGPLLLLAVGAVISGWALHGWFIGEEWKHFWHGSIVNGPHNEIIEHLEHVPAWVEHAPLVVALAGIALAYYMYLVSPLTPIRLAERYGGIYRFLLNKWYFDELYDRIIVRPTICLSRVLWRAGDATIIDGVPNGLAWLTAGSSRQIVKLQTGSLAIYAFAMLIGVVVLIGLLMICR
jgi:NADH-quinone oxidoreductase subunit L